MEVHDFLIIGGGSIGLAIAYRLTKEWPDSSISIIDNPQAASASKAAGAMLGCFGEVTKYTFSHPAYKARFEMMYQAHKIWPAWIRELESVTQNKILHRPGTYIILNTQGGRLDDANFQAVIDALDDYKEPYKNVDPKQIAGLDPTALARPLHTIFLPNEGSVESNHYLEVLRTACKQKGVKFIEGFVENPVAQKSDSYELTVNSEKIVTRNIILATGSTTSKFLRESQLDVSMMPIFSGTGVAMVTRRVLGKDFEHTVRTANRAGSCGLHLVPMEGRREYIGATNVIFAEPEHESNVGMTNFLSQCALEQLSRTLFFSRIESWRVGNRPVSLDTFPLIGKTSLPNLYVATGTYRDGFHCSPVIAENLVNEIAGRKRIISDDFRPERLPIQTMSQVDSMNEYSLQSVSGAYENWLNLPRYIDEAEMYSQAQLKATAIYDRLQTKIALHPDILFYLTSSIKDDQEITRVGEYLLRSQN